MLKLAVEGVAICRVRKVYGRNRIEGLTWFLGGAS
jgi:hypothetical protein